MSGTSARLVATALSVATCAAIPAAPAPPLPPRGLLVLDNCDPALFGKDRYADNLSLAFPDGRLGFRISGLNTSESVGSSHRLAVDRKRGWAWVLEDAAGRIQKVDRTGHVLMTMEDVHASAVAVDPATGNLWVVETDGKIYGTRTAVYDPRGELLARHDGFSGYDIAYDAHGKSFWMVSKQVVRVAADKLGALGPGDYLRVPQVADWCAVSVDTDPRTGRAWVVTRRHSQIQIGGRNRLLCFGKDGRIDADVDLGDLMPFRVSVDSKDGSVWVALLRKAVHRYSNRGVLEHSHDLKAMAVQADPETGGAWVVTEEDVLLISRSGEVKSRLPHKSRSSHSWVALW